MTTSGEQPSAYGEGDLTYEDYLRVRELVDLQQPRSDPPHHDEMLFIIIHQAYELWFKLLRHELDTAIEEMQDDEPLGARHFVHRCVEVLDLLTEQIHVLETMEPVDFLQFRDRLAPASGFQSIQFREIEFACGLQEEAYLEFFDDEAAKRLTARMEEPSLRDAFYGMLGRLDTPVPAQVDVDRLEGDGEEREAAIAGLKQLYEQPSERHPLYLLTESLMSLDEQLGLWREHHVRVVERIIGHKRGTGGSSGVEYLKRTTDKRAFPLLWDIRTYLDGDAAEGSG
jgi:tryptophan 2,3-dioxygenase